VLIDVTSGEKLVLCGDLHGHVGVEANGFVVVHGSHSYGSKNSKSYMLLAFYEVMSLIVANTWFGKNLKQISRPMNRVVA